MTFSATSKGAFGKWFDYVKDKSIENPHITKSFLLHFAIIICLTGLVPTCSRKIEAPKVIAVSIMPMGADKKTSPKPDQQQTQNNQQQPPKPVEPVKKPQDATKMEKAEKPVPVEKPEEKKPAPKKVEKKPEPKKEVKKQDEQKRDDRDQEGKKKLLKDLEKKDDAALDNIFDQASKDDKPAAAKEAQASGKSDVADPAFINELMGKIQSQVSQCWNIPIGAKDIQNMKVRLYIALAANGTVTEVRIIDQAQYASDNVYRVVADSAVWAVKECSPLKDLPNDKYNLWKEIEFTFDPSQAI